MTISRRKLYCLYKSWRSADSEGEDEGGGGGGGGGGGNGGPLATAENGGGGGSSRAVMEAKKRLAIQVRTRRVSLGIV